eukprot:3930245-Amphidinium_carterae.2
MWLRGGRPLDGLETKSMRQAPKLTIPALDCFEISQQHVTLSHKLVHYRASLLQQHQTERHPRTEAHAWSPPESLYYSNATVD